MPKRSAFTTAGLAALFGTLAAAQSAPQAMAQPGDAERGLALARDACSFCHVVEDGGRGSDAVPPFRRLAREAEDLERLRAFTMAPHPQMPQFADLDERQLDDLIAYFRSLSE